MLKYIFTGTWRELTRFIKPLFYRWFVNKVIRQNYIAVYTLENKKLIKTNWIWVIFDTDKKLELEEILNKNNNFQIWEK